MQTSHGKITIVSKPDCKYCGFAKDDLRERGLEYVEVDWSSLVNTPSETELRDLVKPKPLTFPQIFIGKEHVPMGYQGLHAMMEDVHAFAERLRRNGILLLSEDF